MLSYLGSFSFLSFLMSFNFLVFLSYDVICVSSKDKVKDIRFIPFPQTKVLTSGNGRQ